MKLRKSNNSQRGVGREQWGEGFTGTTIKDTWTKSRGQWREGSLADVWWNDGENMQTTVIE